MKNHIAVLIASLTAVSSTFAASYSTEATITPLKDKTQYEAVVRVSQLVQRDGKLAEELIAQPKITFLPGSPASLYSGLQPSNPNYQNEDNVSVDVSWPMAGEGRRKWMTSEHIGCALVVAWISSGAPRRPHETFTLVFSSVSVTPRNLCSFVSIRGSSSVSFSPVSPALAGTAPSSLMPTARYRYGDASNMRQAIC